jgi:hypothetical protein
VIAFPSDETLYPVLSPLGTNCELASDRIIVSRAGPVEYEEEPSIVPGKPKFNGLVG